MESLASSRGHFDSPEGVHLLGSEQFSSYEEFSECGSIISSIDDQEGAENVSLFSSSDYTDFECTDEPRDWDPHIEKVGVYNITTMKVWKNPLFNEPALEGEVINVDSYWCRINPLFVENPNEILASTTCEDVGDDTSEKVRNEDQADIEVCDFVIEDGTLTQ